MREEEGVIEGASSGIMGLYMGTYWGSMGTLCGYMGTLCGYVEDIWAAGDTLGIHGGMHRDIWWYMRVTWGLFRSLFRGLQGLYLGPCN